MPAYIVFVEFRDAIHNDCNEYSVKELSRGNAIKAAVELFSQDEDMVDSEIVSIAVIETISTAC
tara:strand:- start:1102 stop:1293 length:192 start_codon:yes stop_codon:yes gene_type:complete